jgi:ABC-type xylose transport system permease subunit
MDQTMAAEDDFIVVVVLSFSSVSVLSCSFFVLLLLTNNNNKRALSFSKARARLKLSQKIYISSLSFLFTFKMCIARGIPQQTRVSSKRLNECDLFSARTRDQFALGGGSEGRFVPFFGARGFTEFRVLQYFF